MQSTSCHIASRSEMARRRAVRVPVYLRKLGRAPVPVPFLLSTLARPHCLLHIRCQLQVPPKTRTVTNHRPTCPLSRLRHRIKMASRPAGIARILVPSPQTSPMLRSGNVRASYRSDRLDCLQATIWCRHTETRVMRENVEHILCIRMRISTIVPASARKTSRPTAMAGEAHE